MSVEEILYAILIGCAIGLSNSQDATVGCTGEADIVFLVHSSNSLGNSGFRQELNFVQQLIVGFDISPDLVRVGLVTFSSSSELRFPLNRYQDVQGLLKAVKAVPFKKGNAATHMAFLRTRAQVFQRGSGDRRNVTNVIVLLTGEQSRFPDRTLTGARQLKNDGAIIYAVGIGNKV
ncbi:collagen alpha-1(XX) chain-like [Lingula anatina]|uniref:Collagen alpha-1(XX) chain-like n=1 Tax=Lingula anatina TaxID=7574 RepID=A0A1S3J768_LINAN|nr:collagen alpha-1(XX) chain-like [Lingula anatina]|eukprot:XP_013406086.2 collagen alpha-1(XX) chain-like [Lingula anatina]